MSSRHLQDVFETYSRPTNVCWDPSCFQMLPGEVKEQWSQWVNQVPVIGFNSGKHDLNVVKEYFAKKISYNKDDE